MIRNTFLIAIDGLVFVLMNLDNYRNWKEQNIFMKDVLFHIGFAFVMGAIATLIILLYGIN
jgi:hypothetical protein